MVSKRTSAWTTKRFPILGAPRPRFPSVARMLTIRVGVTSECDVHMNLWFADVLDLSKPCRWLVYGFVVSLLMVPTSPLEASGVHHQIRSLRSEQKDLTSPMPHTPGCMSQPQSGAGAPPRLCLSWSPRRISPDEGLSGCQHRAANALWPVGTC